MKEREIRETRQTAAHQQSTVTHSPVSVIEQKDRFSWTVILMSHYTNRREEMNSFSSYYNEDINAVAPHRRITHVFNITHI